MGSIHKEQPLDVGGDKAWARLRVVGDAHKLFSPVLVDCQLNGETRTVRFANGMVVTERILAVDDATRRVAYTVQDGPGMAYHHASMQIVDAGPGRCTFVWITDFFPEEVRGTIAPLVEQGSGALKRNLEA
jgi:Polyketide cyclase / dehydrase and lipid transport